jgi:putative ABC transport system substrate-binding protein
MTDPRQFDMVQAVLARGFLMPFDQFNRRHFVTVLGGAAASWPLAARAQQPTLPVIGFLDGGSAWESANLVVAFLQGLNRTGYVEGRNVLTEYRWAEGHYDRLPTLAADLVRRRVTVIAALGGPVQALAAKATNTTIPIVFQVGADPVEMGLVASLNRPGGTVTGVTSLNLEVGPKRLQLMHELLPTATSMALLINPSNPTNADAEVKVLQARAGALGVKLNVLHASTDRDLDAIFATLVEQRVGGLVIGPDPFLRSRAEQIVALAIRHAVPTVTPYSEFAAAGGLMSCGGDTLEACRQAGIYAGRILKGERPADLPVQQVTKIDFVINLKTAKALGLAIPETLLATADRVIE